MQSDITVEEFSERLGLTLKSGCHLLRQVRNRLDKMSDDALLCLAADLKNLRAACQDPAPFDARKRRVQRLLEINGIYTLRFPNGSVLQGCEMRETVVEKKKYYVWQRRTFRVSKAVIIERVA